MKNQPFPQATLITTQQPFCICEKPKCNYLQNKKSSRLVLVDREMLRKAQRVIKSAPDNTWYWKLCMHMVKQAYGINCKEPLPELGERSGNYICTYVNKETHSYAFSHYRCANKIITEVLYVTNNEVRHA